jgi:hypothetical protein
MKKESDEKKLKGKNFLYNVGDTPSFSFDSQFQFSSLSSETVDEMEMKYLPVNKKKESCFDCYKLLIIEEGNNYYFYGKTFCGELCKKNFERFNLVKILYFN